MRFFPSGKSALKRPANGIFHVCKLARIADASHHAHQDNDHFFLLGCRLKQACCTNDEVGQLLKRETAFANTPGDFTCVKFSTIPRGFRNIDVLGIRVLGKRISHCRNWRLRFPCSSGPPFHCTIPTTPGNGAYEFRRSEATGTTDFQANRKPSPQRISFHCPTTKLIPQVPPED